MRVWALINQKGGVGKTTTALNIAAAHARAGRRTLLVDCDPTASATAAVGVDVAEALSLADVLLEPKAYELSETIVESGWGFDLVPSETALADRETRRDIGYERTLAGKLAPLADEYAMVVLDCPPNLGTLTVNALVAAESVAIVTEPGFLPLRAIADVQETIEKIQEHYNPRLAVAGVIVNKCEGTREAKLSLGEIREHLGPETLLEPTIPAWTLVRDAVRAGSSLYEWQARGHQRAQLQQLTETYETLAGRMVRNGK